MTPGRTTGWGRTAWLLLALGFLPPAVAEDDHERARELRREGVVRPLEEMVARARELVSGRVLEVELKKKAQGLIYEVEMLAADGQVWELRFDAESGRLLSRKKED